MTISDKTRKLLWGRSGNRCAYCRRELVVTISNDNDSIVGDECHIQARHADGSRSNTLMSIDGLDSYENLILLCKVHHKMVDDQPKTYTVDVLNKLKKKHEKWIKETLHSSLSTSDDTSNHVLLRITTGKELFSIIAGVHFSDIDYDELEENEIEFISTFIQNLHDWCDIGDEIEQGSRVEIGFNLSKDIRELEERGFVIFGKQEIRKLNISGSVDNWSIAMIRIIRKTNPNIINLVPDN